MPSRRPGTQSSSRRRGLRVRFPGAGRALGRVGLGPSHTASFPLTCSLPVPLGAGGLRLPTPAVPARAAWHPGSATAPGARGLAVCRQTAAVLRRGQQGRRGPRGPAGQVSGALQLPPRPRRAPCGGGRAGPGVSRWLARTRTGWRQRGRRSGACGVAAGLSRGSRPIVSWGTHVLPPSHTEEDVPLVSSGNLVRSGTWARTDQQHRKPAAAPVRNEDVTSFPPGTLPRLVPDADRGGAEEERLPAVLAALPAAAGTVPTCRGRRGRGCVESPISRPPPGGALPRRALHCLPGVDHGADPD